MKIAIINGPNLNLLGTREPAIYGTQTFEQYFEGLKKKFPAIQFNYYQSNIEGELIGEVQRVGFSFDGIGHSCVSGFLRLVIGWRDDGESTHSRLPRGIHVARPVGIGRLPACCSVLPAPRLDILSR